MELTVVYIGKVLSATELFSLKWLILLGEFHLN